MATGDLAKRLGILGLAMALTSPALVHLACAPRVPGGTLPAQLSDEAFWRLSAGLSEAPGVFTHSDNLVSNEPFLVHNVRQLRLRGGVYIGVGPEQNFSYIARIEPAMAFIIDIRQENRNLHLMYKALFELSADRAEFVSRLFSRERPAGLGSHASANELFRRGSRRALLRRCVDALRGDVRHRLLDAHGWPLSPDDLAAIDSALRRVLPHGPDIQYGRSRPKSEPSPSYRALMTARDVRGCSRSYLATEDALRPSRTCTRGISSSRSSAISVGQRAHARGRLHPPAGQPRRGASTLERRDVSQQPSDRVVRYEPRAAPVGIRYVVHREPRPATPGRQAEDVPARRALTGMARSELNRPARHSALSAMSRTPNSRVC